MPRKSKTEATITGANRPTMGTSAQQLAVDSPSMKDVRAGMTVPRRGLAKNDALPDAGTATHRGQVSAATLGAQYRITARRAPYVETDARTQANGRIVPSATGTSRNFRAGW